MGQLDDSQWKVASLSWGVEAQGSIRCDFRREIACLRIKPSSGTAGS